ncbi:MAG: alcohol dehydrogenase catalytic domain-containing protein [Methyloprofundus sp.]|nr:alcohol dehydrogenase catalytic domain-containing protein [Methyloprofundus sp.]
MKAIAYQLDSNCKTGQFIEFEQATPEPDDHDLLIQIEAISVNPVDYKVRQRIIDPQVPPQILSWDAAGVVKSVGENVSLFKAGDRVFYAGDITRSGSNASHQLVDERIVGHMPKSAYYP